MLQVNPDAPAVDRYSVTINAPIDLVFATLSDFASWPEWQEDVSKATAPEAPKGLVDGAGFTWTSRGTTIRSTIEQLDAPREIGWTGKALGTHAIHIWRLEGDGFRTVVKTEESMHGWLPRLLTAMTRKALRRGLSSAAEGLKVESERRLSSRGD